MKKTLRELETEKHVSLLKQGDERGLAFFYERYYSYLFTRTLRATQDDCAAESIAQEALLRLWLFRERVECAEGVFDFLKKQLRAAIDAFYSKSKNRFHRSLLRLDGIEDYQEFLLGYEMEEAEEEDVVYLEGLEEEKQRRLDKLNNLLPSLTQQQQLFVKLCLKFSFNFERIAFHLGGISDYEVAMQVDRTIETLRSIFNSSEKMALLNTPSRMVLEGEFSDQQAEIFHMRYELQLSFEQISESLRLSADMVKKLFVQAHAKVQSKKTA